MADISIHFKLDLVLYLVDTTTGLPHGGYGIKFYKNDVPINLMEKYTGCYVIINEERRDFRLKVAAPGFYEWEKEIHYDGLSKRYPSVEVSLIPQRPAAGYSDIVYLSGKMEGITSIEAVSMTDPMAKVGTYLERKKTLKLFNALELEEENYALIHLDDGQHGLCYEEFNIAKKQDRLTLVLRDPLEYPVKPEEVIARIIRGQTGSDGSYLLAVREDGRGSRFLVSTEVNGEKSFREVCLQDDGTRHTLD